MMPQAIYDLMVSNPPVAWWPFCESIHASGFTPNCANPANPADLKLQLFNFITGEYCGNGLYYHKPNHNAFLRALNADSRLQIHGDLTIVIQYKVIDTFPVTGTVYQTMLECFATGESLATNNPYGFGRWKSNGTLHISHEYGSGSDQVVDTGISISQDSINHLLIIRRDSTLKRYEVSYDGAAFSNLAYTNNPTGGSSNKFQLPGDKTQTGLDQVDGEYRNVMIFGRKLSNSEVQDIINSGLPNPSWFDFSGWNSNTGTGIISYNFTTTTEEPTTTTPEPTTTTEEPTTTTPEPPQPSPPPMPTIDFIGVPRSGSAPLIVDFTAYVRFDGRALPEYIVEYRWYFDYDRSPLTYKVSTGPTITNTYIGHYGQKFSVKLVVILTYEPTTTTTEEPTTTTPEPTTTTTEEPTTTTEEPTTTTPEPEFPGLIVFDDMTGLIALDGPTGLIEFGE
jgi:hypothetical protein